MTLLIMSSDGYSDCWRPFYQLLKRYWAKHPQAIIVTETKDCNYFETIKTTGAWTKRLREALEQIQDDEIVLMLEDFFIRDYVDDERIKSIEVGKNDAVFNFERVYSLPTRGLAINGFKLRLGKTPYLNSCQPSLHNRLKLIERLQKDQTAWEWELTTVKSDYNFWVNSSDWLIDIGYYNHKPWSIKGGKWVREIVPFFGKEGIRVDYEKRGFFD